VTPTTRFRDLNPLGRLVIVVVAVLTFGIAAVAFITSYDALYDWIASQHLYSDRVNRIWPLLLDAGFIVAQLAAILAGIMRAALHGNRDVHRGWPITAMLVSGGLTVWFNVLHADAGGDASTYRRIAAALPPVLMMLAFEIDVSIVRWVMAALGRPLDAAAGALSPAGGLPAGVLGAGPVPGAVYRPDGGYAAAPSMVPPGWAPSGQLGWSASSGASQNGYSGNGANRAAATKRQQVEAYLAALPVERREHLYEIGANAAAKEVAAALTAQGQPVGVRWVEQIFNDLMPTRRGSGARRRR
jgi:hypothetical protein